VVRPVLLCLSFAKKAALKKGNLCKKQHV